MQTKRPSRFKQVLTSVFNVRQWLDYDRIKAFSIYLWQGFTKMVVPQKPNKRDERFDEVVQEKHLSEADLVKQKKALLRMSYLMLAMAFAIFCYTIYLLVGGFFKAAGLSAVVLGVALTLFFRYNYWAYLIQERRLHCSIREWFYRGVLGRS